MQKVFKGIFNLEPGFAQDGSQFDHLFSDGEEFAIGELRAEVLHVPGHTPADVAYRIGDDAVFVGDTLFMPDVGTARCDANGAAPESTKASTAVPMIVIRMSHLSRAELKFRATSRFRPSRTRAR